MRRTALLSLLALGSLVGCTRQVPAPPPVQVDPDPARHVGDGDKGAPRPLDQLLAGVTEPTKQDRYDAALLEALNLLAEKKETQALASLEAAKAIQDDEQIQREIERLRAIVARHNAADATTANIRAVLDDGRAEEAAKLAVDALAEYGGSDAAEPLLTLKRQADALVAVRANAAEQAKRIRAEADAALAAHNLRTAAVALENILAAGDDAELRKQLDDIHDRLRRYDDDRARAAELRRDPGQLDDALAALTDAQKAWDTPEVRDQIDAYNLALQKRHERLSVADFEVRGDVGAADAGRTLAEELLPAFKARYDLVERGQLAKVVEELKLEAHDLSDDQANRAEVGRLAKVRYLVVGSVSRLGGVTLNARLVDVRSGLVMQTARVTAASADELPPLLPQLATVLMMIDEQKMAYEQDQARQTAVAVKAVEPAPLPPPPDVPAADDPPAVPIVTATPIAPPIGDLKGDDFGRLVPPPDGDPVPLVIAPAAEEPVKLRLQQVCIEVGDNLFRRGRFVEANAQFELALTIGRNHGDVQIRLDRCRPFLPPPVVVVAPPPPRPRLAVLDFTVWGDPDVVPPILGPYTADALAPYFSPPYEVVDREVVCWYMNRMGLSLRDVLLDPAARRWLGRALGVRYFVLGTIEQTHSFVVTTYLVDAESGWVYGSGRIHVGNAFEMKCRLGELAYETMLSPRERERRRRAVEAAERQAERFHEMEEAERWRRLRECDDPDAIVLEIQRLGDKIDVEIALELLGRARKLRPGSIEINFLFELFNGRLRRREWDDARRRDWDGRQALVADQQRRQLELARAAEEARLQAQRDAAARAAADVRVLDQQRLQGYEQLRQQAQVAQRQKNFDLSIQLFQSAAGLHGGDEAYRDVAAARVLADEAARTRIAEANAAREAALLRQREDELARTRLALGEERRRRDAEAKAARDAPAARDTAVYERLLDDGQRFETKSEFDAAVASYQNARQLRRTDEVERLLTQALVEQSRAAAAKLGAKDKQDLERRLAEEKARREKAEAEAAENHRLYESALASAQKAMQDKKYDAAVAKYAEAGKLYNTDIVLTGLRQAKTLQTQETDQAAAERAKREAEAKRADDLKRWKDAGLDALTAKQYGRAVDLLTKAKAVAPADVDLLAALAKAEHAKADEDAKAKLAADKAHGDAGFKQFLDGGKENLGAKQYEAAAASLREAVKLRPDDKEAAAALAQAEKAMTDAKIDGEASRKKTEAYQKSMGDGRTALAAKHYDAAV
jgi:TolB-like protein